VPISAEEARVLGCLLEKERTTPDAYPLSMNALVTACNQSTNRSPVVSYDETTVEAALDQLRDRGFARRGVYPGSRVIKYRHALDEALKVGSDEAALLCVLLLRGPQTPGELKSRTERLHPFADLAAVEEGLDRLAGREEALVRRLAREPGQKEARVCQLLSDGDGGVPVAAARSPALSAAPVDEPALLERVAALEAEVLRLRSEVERLRDALGG
jgi:uncharacterized protein YceH (UPF0502 family)